MFSRVFDVTTSESTGDPEVKLKSLTASDLLTAYQNPLITAFVLITTIRLAMKVLGSQRLIPPSISNSAPTVNAASSEARNTTAFAISLGCPNLPEGICLMNAACSSFDLPE
jgi:hypothetical protein